MLRCFAPGRVADCHVETSGSASLPARRVDVSLGDRPGWSVDVPVMGSLMAPVRSWVCCQIGAAHGQTACLSLAYWIWSAMSPRSSKRLKCLRYRAPDRLAPISPLKPITTCTAARSDHAAELKSWATLPYLGAAPDVGFRCAYDRK